MNRRKQLTLHAIGILFVVSSIIIVSLSLLQAAHLANTVIYIYIYIYIYLFIYVLYTNVIVYLYLLTYLLSIIMLSLSSYGDHQKSPHSLTLYLD